MSTTDQLNKLYNELFETKDLNNYRRVVAENLDVEIATLFNKNLAYEIQKGLDDAVEYYDENSLKVKVFGKWYPVPRKMVRSVFHISIFCIQTSSVSIQAAYSDEGITYTFSGLSMPTKNWIPILSQLRDMVSKLTGFNYNFVLVNRFDQKTVRRIYFRKFKLQQIRRR